MKLKDYTKEELENMSYDDIAYIILTEKKKKMKIIDLFSEIGKLTGLNETAIEDKIGDFFEMLTLDKRFIMLDDGSWDLKERHAQKEMILDDEEEDASEDIEEDLEDELEEEEEDEIFYDDEEEDTDDDLKDLVVINEDEESDDAML